MPKSVAGAMITAAATEPLFPMLMKPLLDGGFRAESSTSNTPLFFALAIVGIFIVAAIITPPDALSQGMLAVPMMILYEVGILAAAALARSKPDPAAE